MALNFPSSPTNGQVHVSGSVVYTYSTTTGAWNRTHRGTALPFNFFVNPSFDVSQQNADTAGSVSGHFPADQWTCTYGGAVVMSTQRLLFPTPLGSRYRIRSVVTTADAALATTDHCQFYTRIEAVRCAPFNWMASLSLRKPMVVRIGFKGPTGTYSIVVTNNAANYNYIANFTISAANNNVDTIQTFAIPVPPAGTWATWNDQAWGFQFSVWLAGGPTYNVGVAGWNNAQYYGTASNTNGIGTIGNSFELFDMGMYLDPLGTGIPPPWQPVDDLTALMDCKRYYYKGYYGIGVNATTAGGGRVGRAHPVTMKPPSAVNTIVPTPLLYDVAATGNVTAVGTGYQNMHFFENNYTGSSATHVVGRPSILMASDPAGVNVISRL